LLVTHDNALKTISGLIGAPNRTNELEEPGKVLYAYDSHGLLIYSQKGVRDEHIVLHLEAIGGAKGTTAPFAGTLKIDDSIISADTDAQTLTSIKSLGLEPPREDKHVFGGQYNGLELYFTFFETTQHLSLIEVKLK